MLNNKGRFIISLDFELFWGMSDIMNINSSKTQFYFKNTRNIIPDYISIFEKYNVKVTWATVGFLFARSKSELNKFIPEKLPCYNKLNLNNFNFISTIKRNEKNSPLLIANSLINKINKSNNNEIASHTFSHFYCNENGVNDADFRNDILSALKIANFNNIIVKSLVLPRNQINNLHLKKIDDLGINVVRINPDYFWWKNTDIFSRTFRLLESYIPFILDGNFQTISNKKMYFTTGSRFLRPFNKSFNLFNKLHLFKIKREMKYAAINNLDYHLWWHPHNFSNNTKNNFDTLNEILNYYKFLENKYDFKSILMKDIYEG